MKFLDKYPSKTLPHSKLPKTDSVLLSLTAHIQEDEERTKNSNSKTLMTDSSIKAAAKMVCQLLKNIWREHFSSSLIDGPGPESILVSDTAILTKLSELASEWKQQGSREDSSQEPALSRSAWNNCRGRQEAAEERTPDSEEPGELREEMF